MAFQGLQEFIELLGKNDELVRVKEFVDPRLEISEITDRISKQDGGGKAILFENTGTGFPVLMNALGSEKRIALAFGRESISQVEREIERLFTDLMSPKDNLWDKLRLLPRLKDVAEWMPKKRKGRGACQEVIANDPDLTKLPVLTCWPADGGPFITLPGVHTLDPETQTPNVGMYRMQIFDKKLTGMHWHRHKTGANHFEKYKKLNKKMPVSVSLGGDPVYTYAATAPMPENVDEYLLAGFLRKKAVKLVKCVSNDLYVPEDSDFVIEGYVDPAEDFIWEGPFGDHTGFYSLADWYPKFHVTCITHRKEAIYPATIVGVPPMEDAYIGLATERIFLSPIRMAMVPELKDMTLPIAGVAHNFTVVKIHKSYPGQAIKVMNSLWGAGQMMFNKVLVVLDESVDIQNPQKILQAFTHNFNVAYSLHFSKGPLDVLDHSSQRFAFGSKLGIDLTSPFPEEKVDELPINIKPFDPSTLKDIQEITSSKHHAEIRTLLLTTSKDRDFNKILLAKKLSDLESFDQLRFVLIFNDGVNLDDAFILFWLLGGNLEPERDITVVPNAENTILIDATFKTGAHDNFHRDWPNIVTMDDKTISGIDQKWEKLGLGKLIKSPSPKLKPLVKGDGAVREF